MKSAELHQPQELLPTHVLDALRDADIQINGGRPWDIQVHNPAFIHAALHGDLTEVGEAYVRGDWDCDQIDVLVDRLCRSDIAHYGTKWQWVKTVIGSLIIDGGSRIGAHRVGKVHYDLSNHLFEAMLGESMTYSCGYWHNAKTLMEAQEAKLDLVCRKLHLKPGMKLLDIGGGWGSFSKFAATHYGAQVTMVTISQNQQEFASQLCKDLPVDIRLQDYRDVTGEFDAVASIGMFEHVGAKHYREFMVHVNRLISPEGLFLLHCIGSNQESTADNPWMEKYIFPGGHIPLSSEMAHAFQGLFVAEDWHNFGAYYDPTLMAWSANFDKYWPELKDEFDSSFYRQWRLYLLGCAGTFRARQLQLWQIVFSRNGVPSVYETVR